MVHRKLTGWPQTPEVRTGKTTWAAIRSGLPSQSCHAAWGSHKVQQHLRQNSTPVVHEELVYTRLYVDSHRKPELLQIV